MFKIAIVEDEDSQAKLIQGFLARYEQEKGVSFDVSVFDDGVKFLFDYHPIYDLVFMDIQMPRLNGLDTARSLFSMDKNIGIVFVTNMVQYAIKGYEVDALDFIVKPLQYYQFIFFVNGSGCLLGTVLSTFPPDSSRVFFNNAPTP